jgi:hypothetical protein
MNTARKSGPFSVPYLAVLAMLAVVAVLCCGSAAASVSVQGLGLERGPNVDLWITDSGLVDDIELCQVVNYDYQEVTLQVYNANTSTVVSSQIVSPHTSAFIELDFPAQGATYRISVLAGGESLIQIVKVRPTYALLPEVGDSRGWHIAPPAPTNPLKYTQDSVDKMMALFTLQNVATAVIVMAAGAIVGAGVKSITRFRRPKDFLTMSFLGVLASDSLFGYLGHFDRIWYVPLTTGYFIGFMLWYIETVSPMITDCKERQADVRPWVVYRPHNGSGWCVQTQTNKELVKRMLGIHHPLGTDTGLIQEWSGRFGTGLFGRRRRFLWVQKIDVKVKPTKIWFIKCNQYLTTFKLSHASGVEKAQWLNETRWYFKLQEKYDRLALAYDDLLLGHRTEATGMAATMVEHSVSVNPAHRVSKFFGTNDGPIDLETGENTFTVIEDVNAPHQEAVAEETPEESEEISYDRQGEPAKRPEKKPKANGKRNQKYDEEED